MVQFRRTQLPMHLVLKTLLKHVKRLKSFVYGSSRLLVGNRDPDAGQGKLPTRLLALPEAAPPSTNAVGAAVSIRAAGLSRCTFPTRRDAVRPC